MSSSDGTISSTTKIVDHGSDTSRFVIAILGDGYKASELTQYHTDVQNFVNTLQDTRPFNDLWCAINVFRVDVTSTDSGADDPLTCADGSAGSGATPKTYFDATFCGASGVRRALTCNTSTAQTVAAAQVTSVDMVMVLVNSPLYGGTGGAVATFSTHPSSVQIGIHEMGHTAFGFADEYEYLAGCGSTETTQNNYSSGEPPKPNITINTNSSTIKWSGELTSAADALPTTANANCAKCDPQANPRAANYVGAYEGANTFHCGCYRPSFNCYMRNLGVPFCAVCERVIRNAMAFYMPAAVPLTWANPTTITYGTKLGAAQLNATATVPGTFDYSPPLGTCLAAGTHTLRVLFSPNDFGTYCFANASVQITVAKATPVVNWTNPANIVYGTPLDGTQLNATASWVECSGPVTVPGGFTYSPNFSTVLNAGAHTLNVSFAPSDTANYNPTSRSVPLTVLKATPTVNWANPADIDHGTPLDNTQLNATASWVVGSSPVNVAGVFAYTPPKTTVLPVGPSQPLSVLFTPTDTANYNSANRTVHLNVLTGYPIVMSVIFDPTTFPQEERTKVTVTVKNDSVKPHTTQGPNPGFEYSEGDTYETKGFPSIAGAYRIAVDLNASPYKKAKLYRWGFGHLLAPGETVSVHGFIRFHNSRENGQYYVAMVEEVDKFLIDHQGTTGITVLRP